MDNEIILIVIVIFVIIGIVFIYIKESELSKKLLFFEKSIEELHKKIYYIEKSIKEQKQNSQDTEQYPDEDFKNQNNEKIQELSDSLIFMAKEIKKTLEQFKENIDNRVSLLEDRTKEYSKFSAISGANERKIVEMFENGKAPIEIARELRIGLGEVDFALKCNGFRQ